ncbi:hypothetical protein G7K_1819-t1 [Saitoella complicata NRRL Y-17804]|uniref:Major facilitator superfamily (MFS) profile domain-containing protein n=1 Tax=Saitoella complicata (strain BCRC 22490 / CBS 7301 / JCM 7358 / NBRC 10748 / NRRL Y-17804) TaxID=698492 RepID=A0A0E9NCQ4_SAICN|nr:hypothetical protein G7K_1819-t1 [Saitoella complicata NRRL Y-17804]
MADAPLSAEAQLARERTQPLSVEYDIESPSGHVPVDSLAIPPPAAVRAYSTDTLVTGIHDQQVGNNALPTTPPTAISLADLEKNIAGDYELVTWLPDDPENPHNWSSLYRWYITIVVAGMVVCVAFGSSVITGDLSGIANEFDVSLEVTCLTTALMVCGFALGPLVFSPLSEMYGRRPMYFASFFLYTVFNIPCALAPNIGALLACRFICGLFASAPLTLAGGSISDIWPIAVRGKAIAYFAAAPYAGPVLGPLVGGWVGLKCGWRWVLWVNMIFAGVMWVLGSLLPETYAPVILGRRAKKMREETGSDKYVTEHELGAKSFKEALKETMVRPFVMLFVEPVLLFMSVYIAMIYAMLYAFFFAYPVVFGETHGFNDGLIGVTFVGILIGAVFAVITTPYLERIYLRTAAKRPGGVATPEDRLPGMIFACPFVPVSLFIFGWTAYPHVSWVGPAIAGIPFGYGMVLIYYAANNYIIDSFSKYVASALAAKTVVRSGGGVGLAMATFPLYHNLGNQWASSLLGFIAIGMCAVPLIFYKWGAAIRARSKAAN